jgi:hypothetical protein
MINPNFVYLGIGISIIGGVDYLIGTLKGTVKPNRVTWLIWTLAPALAFFAQLQQGVGAEAWSTFIVWFIPFLVLVASFMNKKAVWKVQKLDIICGLFSIIGLIAWLFTRVGNVAIVFSIIADFLACIPTLIKSWHKPETEGVLAYFVSIINAAIGLLIIKQWNFENYAFMSYILLMGTIFTILIYFKLGKRFAKL